LTVTNVNFALTTDAGAVVPGVISYSGVSAVFRPLSNLANSTHYNVTVKGGLTGVKDLAGNPMAADFKIGWTTAAAPDTRAPTVTNTIHANGQTNVATNTAIGATFSEGMDPLTITNLNFAVTNDAGAVVPGTVSYSGVNAVFIPLNSLANSTHYNVSLKRGVNGVKDLAGNPMAADFNIGWTTAAAPDITAPTVTSTIHADGATNVAINTAIGATFSEGMDPLTITNLNLFLKATATGTVVPGTLSYSGVTATIIPLNSLAASTNYTVTVKGGVGGVKDLAGNPMASDFTINWTTGIIPDTTAPTVTAVNPLDKAFGVGLNTSVNAAFSEAMDPLTITTASFTVQLQNGPMVDGTVGYFGTLAAFTPLSPLAEVSRYLAKITTAAKDLAGNAMTSDFLWDFVTSATIVPGAATTTTAAATTTTTSATTTSTAGATTTTTAAPTTTTSTTTTTLPPATVRNYIAWSDKGIVYTAPAGDSYYPSVLYDRTGFGGLATHVMWYTDGSGAAFRVTSSNGTSWSSPVTLTGLGGRAHHVQVLYDANHFGLGSSGPTYRMWYWDTGASLYDISAIATAESMDGVNWGNNTALTQDASAQLVTGAGTGWNRGSYGPIDLFTNQARRTPAPTPGAIAT